MRARRVLVVVLLPLLLASTTSGCLADEFLPEPFAWTDAGEDGEAFESPGYAASVELEPPDRTQRLRVQVNATVEVGSSPAGGELDPILGDGPGLNVTLVLDDGRAFTYRFQEAGEVRDLYPASGDGPVRIEVTGRGQGEWSVQVDAFAPVHDDHRWWAFWDRV